jgi:hypothetical protein
MAVWRRVLEDRVTDIPDGLVQLIDRVADLAGRAVIAAEATAERPVAIAS